MNKFDWRREKPGPRAQPGSDPYADVGEVDDEVDDDAADDVPSLDIAGTLKEVGNYAVPLQEGRQRKGAEG